MSVVLDGENLSIEEVVRVARDGMEAVTASRSSASTARSAGRRTR